MQITRAERSFAGNLFNGLISGKQGIPFFDRGKKTVADDFLPGVTQKNMWKGMIGFDRPTWIRWLNN